MNKLFINVSKSIVKKIFPSRQFVQIMATVLGNSYLVGFTKGQIYQGPLKKFCLPGLNCYSCPGAIGSCPLGALQNAIAHPIYKVSFFVLGMIAFIGGVLGRFVCGWLCPIGLFQEWAYRIGNINKKWKPEVAFKLLHNMMLKMKWVILAIFVVAWPLLDRIQHGFGSPMFCRYICPSGTLMAGWPLLLMNPLLRNLAGAMFTWKSLILIALILLSIKIMRPFCRYLCPLGAMYGLFNRISLYRVRVDDSKCTECMACKRKCPMAVNIPYDGNTAECIRCGICEDTCPEDAIKCGFNYEVSSITSIEYDITNRK